MLLNDEQIADLANQGMITPFMPELIRSVAGQKVISFGLSSYGYDLRLSAEEFKIFRHVPGVIIDPKDFDIDCLESAKLHTDDKGEYFIIPGHSYGLGVAFEKLDLPKHITATCTGKSTYARIGLIANVTPVEAGWNGHLTLEFSNSSSADCRIYANEGIVQLLFFAGIPCKTSYEDRKGKYQNQPQRIVTAKI